MAVPVQVPDPGTPDSTGQRTGKGGGKPGPESQAQKILDYAMSFRGTPYVYGGSSPQGFDCSGLVQYVYNHFGLNLPRVADAQARVGQSVSAQDARPGDLVYFQENDTPAFDHIGIYVGNGMMLVAPHTGTNVQIEPVGSAAGFDRVLADHAFTSMQTPKGFTYHLPNGEGVGQAAMNVSPQEVDGKPATGSNGGVGNDKLDPQDVRSALNSLGVASGLINSNKSLHQAFEKIINEQLDLTSSAGQSRVQQILENTAWYQNHNGAQRTFDYQAANDPASNAKAIADARAQLKSEAEQEGVTLDPDTLDQMAKQVARNNLTGDEINQLVSRKFTYKPGQATYQGTAGQAIQSIQQAAKDYYVPITNQQIQKYVRQVLGGNLDPNSLNATFQQQAESMFPYLKSQLQAGQTVADVANPYLQMMANTLELNPDAIKLTDPSIMNALQAKDENGQTSLMTLNQFQQQLYQDPRWLTTDNARQSLVSTTGQVLQKMGLIT